MKCDPCPKCGSKSWSIQVYDREVYITCKKCISRLVVATIPTPFSATVKECYREDGTIMKG